LDRGNGEAGGGGGGGLTPPPSPVGEGGRNVEKSKP